MITNNSQADNIFDRFLIETKNGKRIKSEAFDTFLEPHPSREKRSYVCPVCGGKLSLKGEEDPPAVTCWADNSDIHRSEIFTEMKRLIGVDNLTKLTSRKVLPRKKNAKEIEAEIKDRTASTVNQIESYIVSLILDCQEADEPLAKAGLKLKLYAQQKDWDSYYCDSLLKSKWMETFSGKREPGRPDLTLPVSPDIEELIEQGVDVGLLECLNIEVILLDHFPLQSLGASLEDFIYINNETRIWNGTHYEEIEEGIIKQRISAFARRLYRKIPAREGVKVVFPYQAEKTAQRVLDALKVRRYVSPNDLPRKGLNLANGILSVEWEEVRDLRDSAKVVSRVPRFEFRPHDRNAYYLRVSSVEWQPEASTEEAERLLQVLPEDQRETFLRHLAVVFDLATCNKILGRSKAGLHVGEGSNGKDSLRNAVDRIFGNLGEFTLGDFQQFEQGRQFTLATLPNYRISWATENTHKVKLEGLKALYAAIACTGTIKSEYKGRDAVPFAPLCSFHFNLNQPPITDGGTKALTSRFIVYSYDKVFSDHPKPGELQADPRYAYDLDWVARSVCPGLLVLMTQALERLAAERRINWECGAEAIQEWARQRNHLVEFIDEYLDVDPDGWVLIADAYAALLRFYEENEYIKIRTSQYTMEAEIVWGDNPSEFDKLVKRKRDIFDRLKHFLPKIQKERDTNGFTGAKFSYLFRGIKLKERSPNS